MQIHWHTDDTDITDLYEFNKKSPEFFQGLGLYVCA